MRIMIKLLSLWEAINRYSIHLVMLVFAVMLIATSSFTQAFAATAITAVAVTCSGTLYLFTVLAFIKDK